MDEPIVYFGESLQFLFKNMEIYIIIGNIKINFLDYLPILKQGFSTISGLQIILSTYIKFYGLENIEYNELFEKAFGADIPAEFFSRSLYEGNMENYKKPQFFKDYLKLYKKFELDILSDKILMNEAVKKGFINNAMNTNNIMDFDGDFYDFGINGYVDGILFYNIYDPIYFNINEEIIKNVNLETSIINILKGTEKVVVNGNEIDITFLKYRMINSFKKLLLSDNDIKLYVAILLGDVDKVIQFLKEIDPRLHNNEAYHLAQKGNNKEIVRLVRNRIITLNWYEKMIYEYGLGPSIARDIYYRRYNL